MSGVSEGHARRYLELVEQLRGELGDGRGWMTAAAERLGIHRSTLLRIRKGERAVTSSAIDRAMQSLGLDPSFFTSEGHYRRFTARTPAARPTAAESDFSAAGSDFLEAFSKARPDANAALGAARALVAVFKSRHLQAIRDLLLREIAAAPPSPLRDAAGQAAIALVASALESELARPEPDLRLVRELGAHLVVVRPHVVDE